MSPLQLLNYLVTGPWKDPNGHNFPQSAPFTPSQSLPHQLWGTPFPPGLFIAFRVERGVLDRDVRAPNSDSACAVVGEGAKAAKYAGYDADDMIWRTLLISGGMAGLAGVLEAATQGGQLNLGFPSGYGFTAIIVSFLGRLHPLGAVVAGIVLAISYVGGQVAQTVVHVPNATAGHIPGDDAVSDLASDVFVRRRIRIVRSQPIAQTVGQVARGAT